MSGSTLLQLQQQLICLLCTPVLSQLPRAHAAAPAAGNVCVFKGKWMYEVQLHTRGIMQLGWTTLGARFTSEEGVGDSRDSYA